MWHRHEASICHWKNGASRLARCRVATNLVCLKKKNAISAKHNETMYACAYGGAWGNLGSDENILISRVCRGQINYTSLLFQSCKKKSKTRSIVWKDVQHYSSL